jgi:hypothetical protein
MASHLYWVTVEGMGMVHRGRDEARAKEIFNEYRTYSRQESSSLAGLDVTLVKDGVEMETHFAPRPYPKGSAGDDSIQ